VGPAGCQVATSRDLVDPVWTDAADGRVVVFTDGQLLGTVARVTCDGVMRFRGQLTQNARIDLPEQGVSEEQVNAAMTGARGTPGKRVDVALAMEQLLPIGGNPDSCELLYSGVAPGSTRPPVTLVACGTAGGHTVFAETVGGQVGMVGMSLVNFTESAAVLGVLMPYGNASPTPGEKLWTLVVAPRAATRLEVVRPGQQVESVPLVDGVGSLQIPKDETVQIRALNSAGTVLGTGTAPLGGPTPGSQDDFLVQNWN
jgi:hypothetical protein